VKGPASAVAALRPISCAVASALIGQRLALAFRGRSTRCLPLTVISAEPAPAAPLAAL